MLSATLCSSGAWESPPRPRLWWTAHLIVALFRSDRWGRRCKRTTGPTGWEVRNRAGGLRRRTRRSTPSPRGAMCSIVYRIPRQNRRPADAITCVASGEAGQRRSRGGMGGLELGARRPRRRKVGQARRRRSRCERRRGVVSETVIVMMKGAADAEDVGRIARRCVLALEIPVPGCR